MSNQVLRTIVVSGINTGADDLDEIAAAWNKAQTYFEADLVSPLTSVGHNFVQSFCVFPTGSGSGHPAQLVHLTGVKTFCAYLACTNLDYVAVLMSDSAQDAVIEHAST